MEDLNELKNQIKAWSSELGFEGMGVSNINIEEDGNHLKKWLEKKSPKQYQEYKRGENFYGFKSRKVESMLKSSSPYWKKHSSYPDFNL